MKRKASISQLDQPLLYAASPSPNTDSATSLSILSNPNPRSYTDLLPWPIFTATEPDDSLTRSMSMTLPTEISQDKVPHQPHWGNQETKALISIRGELVREFAASKRSNNRTLWEVVSRRMFERGFIRSPEQCKCKWKNLVNRYKGKETSDHETGRQCPFFEELNSIFTEREINMQTLHLESEAGASKGGKKVKRVSGDRSSDDFSDDEDEDVYDSEDEKPTRNNFRKSKGKKTVSGKTPKADNTANSSGSPMGDVQEILKDFLQQQKIEMQWIEMVNRRARERDMFEEEWRQSMEKLERDRVMTEQAWREREEQRRRREESRAERRDALLTVLLNKLIQENNI